MKKIFLAIFILTSSISFSLQAQNAWQSELLNYVNELRKTGCRCGSKYYPATTPLVWNNKLELAANNHARDMSVKKYFSHKSKNGDTFGDRIEAVGYNWMHCGENIAFGQESANTVFLDWKKSPTHCKNMMSKAFKEIGIAHFGIYWVQDFGTR